MMGWESKIFKQNYLKTISASSQDQLGIMKSNQG